MSRKIYPKSLKESILTNIRAGLSPKELAKSFHVPEKTVVRWSKEARTANLVVIDTVLPITQVNGVPCITLDGFCDMMIAAFREREVLKIKMHELERSREQWRETAGRLTSQLNNS
jgi:hypothetical protein